jgi:hypothetical protein
MFVFNHHKLKLQIRIVHILIRDFGVVVRQIYLVQSKKHLPQGSFHPPTKYCGVFDQRVANQQLCKHDMHTQQQSKLYLHVSGSWHRSGDVTYQQCLGVT